MEIAEYDTTKKKCSKCKLLFPATLNFFPPQKDKKDGFYSQCRKCKAETEKNSSERRKEKSTNKSTAIRKLLGTTDQCGACGTTRGNILGDIEIATAHKYGYLCVRCRQLVHDFQADPERIRNVLKYIESTR